MLKYQIKKKNNHDILWLPGAGYEKHVAEKEIFKQQTFRIVNPYSSFPRIGKLFFSTPFIVSTSN